MTVIVHNAVMNDPARTLEETTDEVARILLERGLAGPTGDARVAALPDARTVRYYQTLGLIDRPILRGREAFYGHRHVLQVVAVKALQAIGLPLADVQARLAGRTDAELRAIVEAAAAELDVRAEAAAETPPVVWREVTVVPGLRILAEENLTTTLDPDELLGRIRAAVLALGVALPPLSRRGGRRAAAPPPGPASRLSGLGGAESSTAEREQREPGGTRP
jgi:DNA-binding transcriptional MerR regulator